MLMLACNETGATASFWRGLAMAGNHPIEPLLEKLYRSVLEADGLHTFVSKLDDCVYPEGCSSTGRPGYRSSSGLAPGMRSTTLAANADHSYGGRRDAAFAERLQPHLHNAYAIQQRLSSLEARILTLHHLLDRLAVGIAVMNVHGHCLFANPQVRHLLAERDGIQLSHGRLRACGTTDQLQLRVLIDLAVRGSGALDARLLLRAPDGRPGLLLTISTLHEPAIAADESAARAIVFVQPVVPHSCAASSTLKELFGFTDAEAALALALFETGDLAAACKHLGKSMATGRVQLRMLMEKTGCHRQSSLFRVLSAALSMPATDALQLYPPTSFG